MVVAYNDGPSGNGDWKFLDLAYSGGAWRGVGTLANADFRYFVQAVDSSGNVAVTTNKGLYYAKATTIDIGTFPSVTPPSVLIASPAAAPSNGIFVSGEAVPAVLRVRRPRLDRPVLHGRRHRPGAAGRRRRSRGGRCGPDDGSGNVLLHRHGSTAGGLAVSSTVSYTVVDVELAGTVGNGGWYTSSVVVSIAGAGSTTSGLTLSVDGEVKTAPYTVDGAGPHTIVLTGPTAASKTVTFKIDAVGPGIAAVPAIQAHLRAGTSVSVTISCTDATSGVSSCTPQGPIALDTSSLGPKTLSVTAVDNAGNTTTTPFAYTVVLASLQGKVVFARGGDIFVGDPFGSGPATLLLDSPSGGAYSQPALSNDGTKVAFVSGGDVYLFNGTTTTNLTAPRRASTTLPPGRRMAPSSPSTRHAATHEGSTSGTGRSPERP